MWASEYISKVRSGWENIYILHTLCLNGFDQFVDIKVCKIDFFEKIYREDLFEKISFEKISFEKISFEKISFEKISFKKILFSFFVLVEVKANIT